MAKSIEKPCNNKKCNTLTKNPKYCSKSCAVIVNNQNPKVKRTKKCKKCSNLIISVRVYCDDCWSSKSLRDMTLSEAIYNNHHRSSAYALVRTRAREIAKKLKIKSCKVCGYNLHVDICHIKPISSYNETTLLSEINNPSNLIGLCKNHHWELDNGYLTL